MSNTLVQTAQPVLTGEALLLAQENLLIAALRRPSLSSTMKLTGINERHFPDHLRPAFNLVLTKSQDEIRHLVALADSRSGRCTERGLSSGTMPGCERRRVSS